MSELLRYWGMAFAAGIGVSLTPCVYPMIPIVLGVFGAREAGTNRWQAFALATMYVLGLGVTYAVLGTIFTLVGARFSTLLADARVVVPLVLIYIVLALSMFGAFELQLPSGWQARINQVGGRGYVGAFFMGTVGAFTAAPCTGPIMGAFLLTVTSSGNVFLGASTLFVHALGIGVLYWLLAVFAGSVPKSGRWMDWVKSIGGIGILCAALYLLSNIWPALAHAGGRSLTVLVVGAGLVLGGLALGAVHLHFGTRAQTLRKGLGVAAVVIGVMALVSFAAAPKRQLPWHHDEAAAFATARASGKGVMIDFWATWCTPCKVLEKHLGEPDVYELITQRYEVLKLDVSEDTEITQELRERYAVRGLPTLLFITTDGVPVLRIDDTVPSFDTLDGLRRALAVLPAP